jgi:hypothetical protein
LLAKATTESQRHRDDTEDNGFQFGEWAAEGSPTEGCSDPRK